MFPAVSPQRFEVPQVVPYSAHQLQPVPVSPVSTGPFNYSCPLVTSFSSSVATLTQFPVNLQSPPPVHPPLVYLQQPVQPQPASLIAPSNPASSSTETPHSYQCSPPQLTIGVSMATATGFQGNPVGIKEASPNLLPDSSQPLCGTLAASPQTALSPPVNPYYELQAVGEQLTLQGVPKSTSRGFPLPLTPYGIIDRRFQQSSSVGDTLPDGSKKEFMITRAEKVSLWRTFASAFHNSVTKLEVTDNSLLAIFLGLPSHIRKAVRHNGGISSVLKECPWFQVRGEEVELIPAMEKLYQSMDDDVKELSLKELQEQTENVPDSWEELSLSDMKEGGYSDLSSENESGESDNGNVPSEVCDGISSRSDRNGDPPEREKKDEEKTSSKGGPRTGSGTHPAKEDRRSVTQRSQTYWKPTREITENIVEQKQTEFRVRSEKEKMSDVSYEEINVREKVRAGSGYSVNDSDLGENGISTTKTHGGPRIEDQRGDRLQVIQEEKWDEDEEVDAGWREVTEEETEGTYSKGKEDDVKEMKAMTPDPQGWVERVVKRNDEMSASASEYQGKSCSWELHKVVETVKGDPPREEEESCAMEDATIQTCLSYLPRLPHVMVDRSVDCTDLLPKTATTATNTAPVSQKEECISESCKRKLACYQTDLQKVTLEQKDADARLSQVTSKLRHFEKENKRLKDELSSVITDLIKQQMKPKTKEKATDTDLSREDEMEKLQEHALEAEQKLLQANLKNVDLKGKLALQLISQAYEESEIIYSMKKMSIARKASLTMQMMKYHGQLQSSRDEVDSWKTKCEQLLTSGGLVEKLPPFPSIQIEKFVPELKNTTVHGPLRHPAQPSAANIKLAANFSSMAQTTSPPEPQQENVQKPLPVSLTLPTESEVVHSEATLTSTFIPNPKSDRPGTNPVATCPASVSIGQGDTHQPLKETLDMPEGGANQVDGQLTFDHAPCTTNSPPGVSDLQTAQSDSCNSQPSVPIQSVPMFCRIKKTDDGKTQWVIPPANVASAEDIVYDQNMSRFHSFSQPFPFHQGNYNLGPFTFTSHPIESFSAGSQKLPPEGQRYEGYSVTPKAECVKPSLQNVQEVFPPAGQGLNMGNSDQRTSDARSKQAASLPSSHSNYQSNREPDGGGPVESAYDRSSRQQLRYSPPHATEDGEVDERGSRHDGNTGFEESLKKQAVNSGIKTSSEGENVNHSRKPVTSHDRRKVGTVRRQEDGSHKPPSPSKESFQMHAMEEKTTHKATGQVAMVTQQRVSMVEPQLPVSPSWQKATAGRKETIAVHPYAAQSISTVGSNVGLDTFDDDDDDEDVVRLEKKKRGRISTAIGERELGRIGIGVTETIAVHPYAAQSISTVGSNVGLDTFDDDDDDDVVRVEKKKRGRISTAVGERELGRISGGATEAKEENRWLKIGSKRKKRTQEKQTPREAQEMVAPTRPPVEDDVIPAVFSMTHLLKKLSEMFPEESRLSLTSAILKVRANHRGQLDKVPYAVIISEATVILTSRDDEARRERTKKVACKLDEEEDKTGGRIPAPKANLLSKLLKELMEKFPKRETKELIDSIVQVRSNHGGTLAGITMTQVICEVSLILTLQDSVDTGEEDKTCCIICLGSLKSSLPLRQLECCHMFHEECIQCWFQKRERTCPVCRSHALLCDDFPRLN